MASGLVLSSASVLLEVALAVAATEIADNVVAVAEAALLEVAVTELDRIDAAAIEAVDNCSMSANEPALSLFETGKMNRRVENVRVPILHLK